GNSDNDWNPAPWDYNFSEKQSNSSDSLDRTIPESRSNYPLAAPKPDKPFLTRPVHNAEAAGLDPEEQSALEELLDEFSDVFSQDPTDIGRARVCEYTIDLAEGAKEFREAPRRMTPERHLKADQQVQILLEMGLIEPSRSSFASGIVMVKKPNGEDRFCVDYRKLNDITQKDAFPLPNITDTIDSIGNAKYFSSMDMGSAFWQIPIEEKSRPYTAFVVPGGFYQWKFMPFGLCNAPA
ncbi:MAG: RNA-directed DNA polymerase, partial [Planctomycetaceae bacterium]|nr:RNA-directed DNA polymerase [Planctomycetaceae bacterium]